MTVWCEPYALSWVELIHGATAVHGGASASAPSGLNFYHFAKREIAQQLILDAVFFKVDLPIANCA